MRRDSLTTLGKVGLFMVSFGHSNTRNLATIVSVRDEKTFERAPLLRDCLVSLATPEAIRLTLLQTDKVKPLRVLESCE
jgi:hypothetical protein